MPDDRAARHHRALATALAGQGTAEQLARHWNGAGERDRAAEHARRAGDEARAKLDFDRAARFYAMALEGSTWTDDVRRELRGLLAEALHDAGRPREAAEQYLTAASGAGSANALELRRRAAGALLQSGYVAEGLALTRDVLAAVGLRMPRTPMRALASMLWRRGWLRLRGFGYRDRPLAEISQAELTRVDVCEGVSFGLALVDSFRAADFATRFLALALRLGETWRVSRALALEADMLAAMGHQRRAERLVARLEGMTRQIATPACDAQMLTTRGMLDFFSHNRLRAAFEQMSEAITIFRAVVGRAGFELDTVNLFCCWCLYYMGELGELARRVPAMAAAAQRSGNRYAATTLRCGFSVAWLARMSPEQIEDEVVDALRSWTTPDGAYQLQHLLALASRVDLALYRGDHARAAALIAADLKPMRRAMIDRPPMHQLLFRATAGRVALATAAAAPAGSTARRSALGDARRHARKLRATPVPLAGACADMVLGAAAELDGRPEAAIALWRGALPRLDAHDTLLYANAVRARLGALLGGDEGDGLRGAATMWLESQGVGAPAPMLTMLLPDPQP
jgi:hypothetical protein